MSVLTLSELNIREKAQVISIGNKELELKLISMGCIPGESISVERKAPFGDPLLIRTSGCLLSIRKVDATNIIVKKAVTGEGKTIAGHSRSIGR